LTANIKRIASNSAEDETRNTIDHIKSDFSFNCSDCLICVIKYRRNIKGKAYEAVPKAPNATVANARPSIPDLFGKIKAYEVKKVAKTKNKATISLFIFRPFCFLVLRLLFFSTNALQP
jgi:hypothetical protein